MEQRKDGHISNVFYAVIGVATLMIAIIGATFAYYTATATNATTLKGNMATISFDLDVKKVTNKDDTKGGLIPMSNNMMEQALTKNAGASDKGICVDDNGNAVCQVYKITVVNIPRAEDTEAAFIAESNNPLLDLWESNGDRKVGKCEICGKKFTVVGARKTCSDKCSKILLKKSKNKKKKLCNSTK